MRTSNAELLAEIDTLEEITRKEAKDLEVVKTIEQLKSALKKLTHQYESHFEVVVIWRLPQQEKHNEKTRYFRFI